MAGEPRQVVLGARGADRGVGVAEHDEIGLAVERQFEPLRGICRVEHQRYSRQCCARRHQSGNVGGASRVDADKRPERAVMAHERVGDRTDHPYRSGAETAVELVFEKNHVGLAVGLRLVVHAVVGDETDDRAQFDKGAARDRRLPG